MGYSDNKIYAMNPSNCINKTFLPLCQILIEAIQFQLLRTNTKILVSTDSKVVKPDLLEDKNNCTSLISGNSYLIVHDRHNWYHFIMDTMIPLYQILASQHISFDNVIVPASLYDNQNAIQLLKTLKKNIQI